MIGKKQVKKMYKEGFNDEEIATKLGVPQKEVFKVRRKNDWVTDQEKDEILRARRKLIIAGGATLGLIATGGISYLFREKLEEVLYEIKHPISQRQQSIDQLVRNDPSPYVEHVYYDHDESLIKSFPKRYSEKLLSDSRYQAILDEILVLDKEKGLTKAQLEEMTRKGFEESYKPRDPDWPAVTTFYPLLFGRGFKAEIYFFRNAFQKEERDIMGKAIKIPVHIRLKGLYKHECFHVKHFYEGIKINNGLTLNSSNFLPINKKVAVFMLESAAYMDTYEFFKQTENGTLIHLHSAAQMAGYIEKESARLKGLTPFEEKIARIQVDKYNKLVPEVTKLYGKFAK